VGLILTSPLTVVLMECKGPSRPVDRQGFTVTVAGGVTFGDIISYKLPRVVENVLPGFRYVCYDIVCVCVGGYPALRLVSTAAPIYL